MDKKLDCCVVRDLLPAYIEELTEEETSTQVRAHLEVCGDCQKLEEDMRAQVPVEKAPKRALNFLKRVKRTRLLAAGVSLVLTLWCIWALYDSQFHYPNTEAGRQAAAEDHVSHDLGRVGSGTVIHCAAYQEQGNRLLMFYKADNSSNVHGILELKRGLNGKYAAVRWSNNPSALQAGLYTGSWKLGETEYYYLAGYDCREIYSARVEYIGHNFKGTTRQYAARRYTFSETNFLWLWEYDSMVQELGWKPGLEDNQVGWLTVEDIHLFDRDGRDITQRYTDESVVNNGSWRGGGFVAEPGLVYFYIGIVAVLGWIFIRYFLRKD